MTHPESCYVLIISRLWIAQSKELNSDSLIVSARETGIYRFIIL